MPAKPYSTLVAANNKKAVSGLRSKAKAAKAANEATRATMQNRYGTAMSGVVNTAFKPLTARVNAGASLASARVAQAAAAVKTSQQSNYVNSQVGGAMATGQKGVLARVEQAAKPGFISADQAIQNANEYMKEIGINIEKMSWDAKAAVYQSIIDQNGQMLQTVLQAHLDRESQRFQYRLATKEQEKTELAGATQVVQTVQNAAPSLIGYLSSADSTVKEGNKIIDPVTGQEVDVSTAATSWAFSLTADTHAAAVLSAMFTSAVLGAKNNTADGTLNGDWFRGIVTSSIHSQYPSFAGDADVSAALDNAVLSGGIATAPASTSQPRESWGGMDWLSQTALKFGGPVLSDWNSEEQRWEPKWSN